MNIALKPLFLCIGIGICMTGCLISDPAFKVNSKDAILASKKHVVVTAAPTPTKVPAR